MKKLSFVLLLVFLFNVCALSISATILDETTTQYYAYDMYWLLYDDALEHSVNVSVEEARLIAEGFISNMNSSEEVAWNENTEILSVIPMYDQTQNTVNAYSVELTEGYIIVSAYMDVNDVIFEWSDESLPIYSDFETDVSSKLIYLGNYDYYVVDNNGVLDLYGNRIDETDLINSITQQRDISNLPIDILNYCSVSPQYIPENWVTNPSLYPIVDPFSHVTNYFGRGTFRCSDYCNKWENYMEFFTYGNDYYGVRDWPGSCGPTAITNIILAYNNRYPNKINISSATSVMDAVCIYGQSNNYYTPGSGDGDGGGTHISTTATYILNSLRLYDIATNVVGSYDITYNNVKTYLKGDDLLYMVVYNNTYLYHVVLCYAYTRLVNEYGDSMTYVKVADGLCDGGRYMTLQQTNTNPQMYPCSFIRIELWG